MVISASAAMAEWGVQISGLISTSLGNNDAKKLQNDWESVLLNIETEPCKVILEPLFSKAQTFKNLLELYRQYVIQRSPPKD